MDEKIISQNLAAIGELFDCMPTHILKYLNEIQGIINQKEILQQEGIALIKSSSLSVASTMAELGYSRNTAYRHGGVLQRYIEHANKKLSKTNPLHIIDELRQEIRDKDKQLSLIVESNVTNLLLQEHVTQLEGIIADKNIRIEELQRRIAELSHDVLSLRAKLPRDKSEPVLFVPK